MEGVRFGQPTDSRLKFVSVSPTDIFMLLGGWRQRDGFRLPYLAGPVPDGAAIVTVVWNYLSQHFDILLRHDSFDPVLEGELIPKLKGAVKFQMFVSARMEEVRKGDVVGKAAEDECVVVAPDAGRAAKWAKLTAAVLEHARENAPKDPPENPIKDGLEKNNLTQLIQKLFDLRQKGYKPPVAKDPPENPFYK